jgi:hypothetical protein
VAQQGENGSLGPAPRFGFCGSLEQLGEFLEDVLARRCLPPHEADGSHGHGLDERHEPEVAVELRPTMRCHGRQQGHPGSAGNHRDQGAKTAVPEVSQLGGPYTTTDGERLAPKTVTILEKKNRFSGKIGLLDARASGEPVL